MTVDRAAEASNDALSLVRYINEVGFLFIMTFISIITDQNKHHNTQLTILYLIDINALYLQNSLLSRCLAWHIIRLTKLKLDNTKTCHQLLPRRFLSLTLLLNSIRAWLREGEKL